ncbi:olfactory receptor 52K2 [Alosa sapidissima]|uniref:olfactory receptor 52K2 n=1 Tax=Alosa sapidissima TaxID=34773 RepID=UPI001C08D7EB|nr:olfactory receptor 52K2 [Alosa sapidissima]
MFEHAEPMSNVTLLFTAYGSPGSKNHGVLFITLLLYVSTVLSNVTILLVIYFDSSLHKPMYIFLFNLAINGLIGTTAVCPKIMANLLKDNNYISLEGCLIQVLFINVYACCAYAIFAGMAYDRYVSICKPLQYHSIMTPLRVKVLLAVVYLLPTSLLSFQVYLTSRLPLCGNNINKMFCDNLVVVNLSCVRDAIGNLYGLCLIFVLVVLPLFLVILSYIKIISVSLRASTSAQKKALQTCAPHLITFINFSLAILFSVIYNRISHFLPQEVNILMSLEFILIPPLLHPLIYGIKTKDIRKSLYKIFRRRVVFMNSETDTLNQNRLTNKIFFF